MILEELQKIKDEIVGIMDGFASFDMLREKLKKDFQLDGLKEKLRSIPEDIENKQKEAQQIRSQIPNIETEMKEIEADLAFQISMEMNGTDKPKPLFSNADSRKAELIKRLKINKRYIELKQKKADLDFALMNFDFEVDRLRNTFRVNLAIKDLIVAEMNLYRN